MSRVYGHEKQRRLDCALMMNLPEDEIAVGKLSRIRQLKPCNGNQSTGIDLKTPAQFICKHNRTRGDVCLSIFSGADSFAFPPVLPTASLPLWRSVVRWRRVSPQIPS
jgi:hypothetical protein